MKFSQRLNKEFILRSRLVELNEAIFDDCDEGSKYNYAPLDRIHEWQKYAINKNSESIFSYYVL